MHEADVLVGEIGLDLQMRRPGHDHQKLLRGGNDTAHRVHGELLHRAVDRRAQGLQVALLRRLARLLAMLAGLALGLGEIDQQRFPELGGRLDPLPLQRRDGLAGLVEPVLLHDAFVLGLHHALLGIEVEQLGAVFDVHGGFADVALAALDRQRGVDLLDGGGHPRRLGAFLRHLAIEPGELRLLLGRLRFHLPARRSHRIAIGPLGRRETLDVAGEQRGQSHHIELVLEEIAAKPGLVGLVRGRVDLDEHIAGNNGLAIRDMDGPHHAGLERLDQLGPAGRDDPPRRGGDDIDMTDRGPGEREHQERDDGCGNAPADRRGRGLDDLQRRGQEFQLVAARARDAPRQRDNGRGGLSGLHATPPAGDEGWHNGRWCGPDPRGCRPRPGGRAPA